MKLLTKILITSAALTALSTTLAFGDDNLVLTPNGHGSYSQISRTPDNSTMIGLSVLGSGGQSANGCQAACSTTCCMDRAHGSSAVFNDASVTFRDNAHGTQVPR